MSLVTIHASEVACPKCFAAPARDCQPTTFEVNVIMNRDGNRRDFHEERWNLAMSKNNHPSRTLAFIDDKEEAEAFAEFIKLTSEDMAEYDEA